MSKGFKAPQVQALHDGINGATAQGATLTIGNPELKPEKSINYEIGTYYSASNGFSANATIFYNKYKDKIERDGNVVVNGHSSIPDGTYAKNSNIGEAETKGLEFGTRIPLMQDLNLRANYTYMKTEKKEGADKGGPFVNTPKHAINATLDYKATKDLSAWLKGEYKSKRSRYTKAYSSMTAAEQNIYDQLGDKKSYSMLHLGGSYEATKNITFSATIYNLLDKDFYKRSAYQEAGVTKYIADEPNIEGRRLWLAMNVTF